MIPTKKYLETMKELRKEVLCVYYEWFKSSKTLCIVIPQKKGECTTIKVKCRDDKQYDYYVKVFEECRHAGDVGKFLKRVKSKIISID